MTLDNIDLPEILIDDKFLFGIMFFFFTLNFKYFLI